MKIRHNAETTPATMNILVFLSSGGLKSTKQGAEMNSWDVSEKPLNLIYIMTIVMMAIVIIIGKPLSAHC